MSAGPSSLLLSRRDLEFLLYDWLDAEALTRAPRYRDHSRETFDSVLDTCERIASERFAPHYQKSDREEPRFDGRTAHVIPEVAVAVRAVAESGLIAATHDYERGGMQLPFVIDKAGMAYFNAANVGTAAYPFLSIANANLLVAHASQAQIRAFADPILRGRFFGTMCLSETQAGTSLADVATCAEYEGESALGPRYRVSGSKMWISGGEHEMSENIVHLVLARVPGADGRLLPGVKGLSLLIVPKFLVDEDGAVGERNDVVLAGLNHKMGYRGTTNCFLKFGEGTQYRPQGRAGAVGFLVGKPHHGMAYMFHMMNEARVGVGLGAASLGYTGYLHALDYARTRRQGRVEKDPLTPQRPIVEHADVRRMLLAQKAYVEGALGLNLFCARLIDEQRIETDPTQRHRLQLLLELLTPVAKSWPSQWCLAANDLAIQVHGGYGYTREYKVEQFYRDNRLNPIHEGTHGIQGLDLLGRKVTMENGAALEVLGERIARSVAAARANGGVVAPFADALERAWRRTLATTTCPNASR
jgi:alkylation response protein AidB-like acyl-CoA dehydrogenase